MVLYLVYLHRNTSYGLQPSCHPVLSKLDKMKYNHFYFSKYLCSSRKKKEQQTNIHKKKQQQQKSHQPK